MKFLLTFFSLLTVQLGFSQSYPVLTSSADTITLINDSTNYAYSASSCGALSLLNSYSSYGVVLLQGAGTVPAGGTYVYHFAQDQHLTDAAAIGTAINFSVAGVSVGSWTINGTDNRWNGMNLYVHVNGSTCSVSGTNAPPVYTNYVYTAYNFNTVYRAQAVWTYNGQIVKTSILPPSGSDTWTTPSLKVSPPPADTFSVRIFITTLYSVIGTDGGGGFIFTNPSTTGSAGGTAGGTITNGSGGTLTGGTFSTTNSDTPIVVSTNGVVWAAPSGAASESTLQGGFSLLHKDNNDQLSALNIINQSINAQTFMVTNQLGQIAVYARSNNDAMWNLIGVMTNMSAKINTNTSSLSLTNYAQQTTLSNMDVNLAKISNSLTNANTNSLTAGQARMMALIPSTATNASSATAQASSIFATALGYLSSTVSDIATPPDVGGDPGHSGVWEFQFCGQTVDLDPVNRFPAVFSFSYGIWSFILAGLYLMFVGRLYVKTVQILATAETGGVPNMDVFGGLEILTFGGFGGGNFIGVLVAVIIPAVFLAVWVVVVTAVVAPLGEFIGMYHAISSVFSVVSSTSAGSAGMHLLFASFPVATAIRLLTAALTLQFTMAQAMLLASGVSRFLFGK